MRPTRNADLAEQLRLLFDPVAEYYDACFVDYTLPERLGRALPPHTHDLVRKAYVWAGQRYGKTTRSDGQTAFWHAKMVARNLVKFGPPDAALVIAAVLHDLLEATDTTAEEIEYHFGARVARLVEAVTNPPGEDVHDSAARAVAAGPEAILLRLCDRLQSIAWIGGRTSPAQRRFVLETREVYLPLAEQHFPEIAAEMRQALAAAERTLG
jgi:(p)ppGpp synthase/HD superfamily hydrolase